MSSTLESYELIRFAEAFEARLATAGEMLTGRPGLDAEKGWLTTALELVRTARAPTEGVLDRVKDLPELEEAREEYAFHQQGMWVDVLEKLLAGITFTASSRAPVIEALFPHLKFPQLRRAPREAVLEYATSYERRTKSAYVTRIFARDDFALVRPVMEQVLTAHTAWRSSHEPSPLTLEQEALLREELVSLGRKLEQSLRQARLLAEAALVPAPTVYEAAGLNLKPKRRAGRGLTLSDDALAGFDEPTDSMEPTEAELAEVAALDSGGDIASPAAVAPSAARGDTAAEGGDSSASAASPEVLQDSGAERSDNGGDSGPVGGAELKAEGLSSTTETGVASASTASESNDGAVAQPEAAAEGAELADKAAVDKAARVDGGDASPQATDGAVTNDSRPATTDEAAAQARNEASSTAPRGARRGRKKADAAEPAATEATEPPASGAAQVPRIRKKKASSQSAPPTPDADTP
ncbi:MULTISPECIES: hypothetical protein [Myxococcus]|nr:MULTISPECIES: hypothetical protein [Myxococcus]QZZ50772.1 hypothetical protein MyxoNM_16310 [Myxococcus xanthus]UYI17690.1 hypothetical protein N3T43_15690 [Myxococcus xanthus]UYI25143.1 hypothetical protein N1129_16145 [Myxococcus xanthus]SDX68349.1 hypothetical protein SAMN05444383_11114 [Myxococcus xanthus]